MYWRHRRNRPERLHHAQEQIIDWNRVILQKLLGQIWQYRGTVWQDSSKKANIAHKSAATTIYLLLCGGDKKSQGRDIKTALHLADEWSQ